MRKFILAYLIFVPNPTVFGQTATPDSLYPVFVKQADSLYKLKDYTEAAYTYSAAFKTFGGKGYVDDRYKAACCWAMSGNADSAFFNLEWIAEKANYGANFSELWDLKNEDDLESLQGDKRWLPLLKIVCGNKEKSEAGLNKPLIHLLDSLIDEDQKWRGYKRRKGNHRIEPGADTISSTEIDQKMTVADSLDFPAVEAVFKEYGYPDYDMVGKEGANNFWVLVQHQDRHPDFQDSVLVKLKIKVAAKKASGANYAYLVDRVKINTHQLQVYGTQMKFNADSTSYEPMPTIEPEKLNERRKSIGMGTIESYIKTMNERFYGKLKKK